MRFLILILLCSVLAHATILVPLTEDQAINSSSLVIYGEVVDQESNWTPNAKRIVTDFKVKVVEFYYPCDSYGSDDKCLINESLSTSVANNAVIEGGSRYVFIRTLGGSTAGVSMKVAGSPRFALGSKYVFMLREIKSAEKDAVYKVVGFSQGVCKVTKTTDGDDLLKCAYENVQHAKHGHGDKNVPLSVHGSKISTGRTSHSGKSFKGFKSKLHKKGQK